MNALPRRLGALLALAGMVLCLPQGLLVLCVADGHLSLEPVAPAASFAPGSDATNLVASPPCDCETDCGPCRDSQLGSGYEWGRLGSSRPQVLMAAGPAAVLPALLPDAAPSPPSRAALRRAATPIDASRPRRSTVLRI